MWNKIFVVVERQPYSFSGVLTQIKAMNLNAVAKKEKTRLDRSSYLPQWLNPRAGKMKPILHSDWLPERIRPLRISRVGPTRKSSLFDHIINPLLPSLLIDHLQDVVILLLRPEFFSFFLYSYLILVIPARFKQQKR